MSPGLPAVLVASGGGFQGLAVVRLLREADAFRVVVADSTLDTLTAALVDATRRVPPVAERAAFAAALQKLCRAEAVRLVLPSTDHELEALAEVRAALEAAGTQVAVCDPALLAVLRDKASLYGALAAAALPVLAPIAGALETARFPLIGKPRHGFGGRGIVVARTPGDLDALGERERRERVWQPYLEGASELSADFALLRDGSTPGVGLRRRVRTSGGFAVVSEGVRDEPALELVRRFAAWAGARGGRGLFNVQLLRRGRELVLSDVNPRLGTSAVHWRGSGFNPALALCAEAGLLKVGAAAPREPGLARSVRRLDEQIEPLRPEAEASLRGLVLDLDDTLIPTKRWLRDRLFAALESVVAPEGRARAESQAARVIEEGPRDRLIDAAAAALGLDERGRVRLLESYTATSPASCACYPDVRPALDALRRRGLKLGLLTDNPPETQRRKLAASGLSACFDAVVFARETGAEKPDARAFAAVAAALGLPPASLAMAGDNPYRDLRGAAEAGFARLFWVRRDGAASAFDPALAGALPGASRFEPVADLREILARLGPEPAETP